MSMFEEYTLNHIKANHKQISPEDMFYDWFCDDDELENRGRELLAHLMEVINSPMFSKGDDKYYVFFKNNCPLYGDLYDDFRICNVATGDVLYTVCPSSGYTKNRGQASVYGKSNNFNKPLVEGAWEDVAKFFMG